MSGRPDFYEDPKRAAALLKEQRSLEPVVSAYRRYLAVKQNIDDMLEMLSGPLDGDMKELCQQELDESKGQLPQLEQELKILLLPKDPNDDKNVILEIRAGVGGEESALFAHSLYRMYAMYAEKKGWSIEITTLNETELGGVKELVCMVTGQGAYSRLKFETGVHRVQRVPETESGGRVHTSTATVAMLPEVDEVSVDLNPADIKMEVFRSSGAGGQHINKTSSAVRLIHLPTGTVVECQQERSQVQNREKAMRILYSRLYQAQQEAQAASLSAEKRAQVGMGMRNEKIRTYNFPQSRVTDHRIGLTLYKLSEVLDGDLDEIIDALITADQAKKLSQESDTP
jgi:peptide chain release factor 1